MRSGGLEVAQVGNKKPPDNESLELLAEKMTDQGVDFSHIDPNLMVLASNGQVERTDNDGFDVVPLALRY